MKKTLNILYASAEVVPFAKAGGLADVAGALPKALMEMGHDVRVVTPRHNVAATYCSEVAGGPLKVNFLGREETITIYRCSLSEKVPVYLLDNASYLSRRVIYGEADDLFRYLLFCYAILEVPKILEWRPDVWHCNDWHTAPVCFGLRNKAWSEDFYRGSDSVLSIHNLRYRGPDHLNDFMCQGIYYADAINTVSPTYAQEILTPESGEGLDSLLRLRKDQLSGILNGLDVDMYNPETDACLCVHFDADSIEKRAENKKFLQEQAGLEVNHERPVIGMVSRLTEQKGIDIVAAAIESLMERSDVQIVILGSGQERYERMIQESAARFSHRVSLKLGFDPVYAQCIYGGADMFLMPSRYEPCGLGQLIAMRYGAIPVVRRTGGLADTVQDYNPTTTEGTGFVFTEYNVSSLLDAVDRSLAVYGSPGKWRALVRRDMLADFSWAKSAKEYEGMYLRALESKMRG